MKLFRCQVCANIIHFENRTCGRCSHRLGYVPELGIMTALEPLANGNWEPAGGGGARRFCVNADHDACKWLIRAGAPDRLCVACAHNHTIPDISNLRRISPRGVNSHSPSIACSRASSAGGCRSRPAPRIRATV